jgi:hypothetical protein
MKFFVILKNTGSFGEAAFAAKTSMKMRKSGAYGGWITKEDIDVLDKGGFYYKVVY